MRPDPPSARLFQRAAALWVLGFTLSAYGGPDQMNVMMRSPAYLPPGPLRWLTHLFPSLPDGWDVIAVLIAVPALLALCLRELLRPSRWWSAMIIWFLHTNLMNNAWLAGSGGQQLMANALFWCIFLPLRRGDGEPRVVAVAAFWIIRLQVPLAYAATGLHKLMGAHWLDGTALAIAATDDAFGPAWIAGFPLAARLLTWSILLFQLSFPIAVWIGRLRPWWLLFGAAFHLATALWMDIPEMGLAFIACYAAWLDGACLARAAAMVHRGRSWLPFRADGRRMR